MPCLDELTVLALVEGGLGSAATDAAEAHIDACADCRELLAVVARTDENATIDRSRASFEPGEIVGRYLVLHRVGAGGMGEVYAAWDTELDRRVALKVVADDRARDVVAQRELVREAKALASINHANVITVYDVGEIEGRLFLAMEFMDGGTLAAFLARSPRASWRVVLARFLAAGDGLAAAHHVGLVHRDFKPDNVLLGEDDRVCVTDFGLARAHAPTQPSLDATEDGVSTRAAGTPAYMAPEQLRGDEITARADQFGFCVAVWEGLFGERPFTAASPRGLLEAIETSAPRAGEGRNIPTAIRRVLARGLSFDATQRFATLDDLLAALRGAARPRRVALWAGAAAVVLAGVGAWGLQREPACPDGRDGWEAGWSASDREALRRGFEATGASYAASTFERFEQRIDAYVDAWTTAYRAACLAARVSGDERVADARTACLDGHRTQALHLLGTLAQPDRADVQKALAESLQLPKAHECEDDVDASSRADIVAVEAQIANASRLDRMGRFDEAAQLLDDAEARAEALQDKGLLASVTQHRAIRTAMLGEHERGRDLMIEAALSALSADRPTIAAEAFGTLVHMDGRLRGEPFTSHWRTLAEAMLARLGPVTRYHAHLANAVAYATGVSGDLDGARAAYERAVELDEETIGRDAPRALATRGKLAHVLLKLGEGERAVEILEDVLARQIDLLGEVDRDVAMTLGELGNALMAARRGHEAIPHYERSIAIKRELFGPRSTQLLTSLNNFGFALVELDEPRRALEVLEEARALPLPPGRADTARSIDHMTAQAHARLGERERAVELWRAALATSNDTGRVALMQRYLMELELGRTLRELGQLDEARLHLRRATSLAIDLSGFDDPNAAVGALEEAMISLAKGKPELELLERAVELDPWSELEEYSVLTPFYLAQALVASGGDHARAVALAVQAHARSLVAHPTHTARILAWIEEQGYGSQSSAPRQPRKAAIIGSSADAIAVKKPPVPRVRIRHSAAR